MTSRDHLSKHPRAAALRRCATSQTAPVRRLTIGLLSGTLVLAACGGSDTTSDDTTSAPTTEAPVTEEPASETEPTEPSSGEADAADTTAPPTTAAPADDIAPGDADDASEPAPAPEPEPTTTLAPEPAPPPLGGRELGAELRPESASGNPLPDLLVDDIRRGVQVNVANVLPSDRPVLVWAWAPH